MTVGDYVAYCVCAIATGFAILAVGGAVIGIIGLALTIWG